MLQLLKKLKLYTKLGSDIFLVEKWGSAFVCLPVLTRSQTRNNWCFFSEISTQTTVRLNKKRVAIPRKMLVCNWNLPYLEVNGIKWS